MHDIVRVDGSPGTVVTLLRRGVRSPHTVACPLCMSGRSAPYCRRTTASMSCTHLMPVIRCVWPITYAFNALSAPRAWRGHDGPDVRRLPNARARQGLRATGHVAAPEPSRTRRRVWSHRTRGDTGALSGGGPGASVTWRCQSLPAQGAVWSHPWQGHMTMYPGPVPAGQQRLQAFVATPGLYASPGLLSGPQQ
jgi:hypothetical protein